MSGVQQLFASRGVGVVTGQQAYTTPGTYSWVCPAGVTSVSVVCVGAGAAGVNNYYVAGGGGGLGYQNNVAVTPGNTYTVTVGDTTAQSANNPYRQAGSSSITGGSFSVSGVGGRTHVYNSGIGGAGGGFTGTGGGNGGAGGDGGNSGGGGAGGYAGNGGAGAADGGSGSAGAGGGGNGGDGNSNQLLRGSGGGTGVLGQTTSQSQVLAGNGGLYGGGGSAGLVGAVGAVRIIWPGTTRQFPSTSTGDAGTSHYAYPKLQTGSGVVISNNGLTITRSGGSSWVNVRADLGVSVGKWYFEVTAGDTVSGAIGVSQSTIDGYPGAGPNSIAYQDLGNIVYNGGNIASVATWNTNPGIVLGVAVDKTNNQISFYRANVLIGTYSFNQPTFYPLIGVYNNGASFTCNFGETPMVYTAPSGFTQGFYN